MDGNPNQQGLIPDSTVPPCLIVHFNRSTSTTTTSDVVRSNQRYSSWQINNVDIAISVPIKELSV